MGLSQLNRQSENLYPANKAREHDCPSVEASGDRDRPRHLQEAIPWHRKVSQHVTCHTIQTTLARAPLTSIPSLFKAYSSKFRMAILIVLGGGSTVRPILMALLLLESRTIISCLFPSAAVFLVIKQGELKINATFWVLSVFHDQKQTHYFLRDENKWPWVGLRKHWLLLSRDQGPSSAMLPSFNGQWNFMSQTHCKIKWIFLQLGKCDVLQITLPARSSKNKIKICQNHFWAGCRVLVGLCA